MGSHPREGVWWVGPCPIPSACTLLLQPACTTKAATLGMPPLPLHTIISQADNEERTAIQKNAWLQRLRTCPNCTCRCSFPEPRALAALHLPQASSLPLSHIPRAGCRPWPAPHPAAQVVPPPPLTPPWACAQGVGLALFCLLLDFLSYCGCEGEASIALLTFLLTCFFF